MFLALRVATDADFERNIGGVLIEAETNKEKLKGLHCHDFLDIYYIRYYNFFV